MSARVLVTDPLAERGVRRVSIDTRADLVTVDVDFADGTRHLRVSSESPRRVLFEVDAGSGWRDVTAAPAAAVEGIFAEASAPDLCRAVLAHLAEWSHQMTRRGTRDSDAGSTLLHAGHPALGHLQELGPVHDVSVSALPAALSPAFRCETFTETVTELLRRPPGRGVIRAAASCVTSSATLRVREISALPAMTALPDDDVAELIEPRLETEARMSALSEQSAQACGGVLGGLGRPRHRQIIGDLLRDPLGLRAMRRLAAAASSGLDVSGLRGREVTGWLLDRVREALQEGPDEGDLAGKLHGLRVDATGTRLRVATRHDEFSYLGNTMGNCLGSHGPRLVAAGSLVVVVVTPDGRPTQALQIGSDRRVREWLGPGNHPVPSGERAPVEAALDSAGIVVDPASIDVNEPF